VSPLHMKLGSVGLELNRLADKYEINRNKYRINLGIKGPLGS
jgi:hypothetical protein